MADSQLNWSRHLEQLTIKLSRNSNLIKYNKNTMPRSTKLLIYHAHITSHIQYGLTLWGIVPALHKYIEYKESWTDVNAL